MDKFNYPNDEIADAVAEVLDSVENDVKRALTLWGVEFDDKNTANDWCSYVCNYVSNGAYDGRQQSYHPDKFRANLSKAAGLCVAAMLAIDRNGDCAPRHYEKLPYAGAKEIEENNSNGEV